MSSYNNAYEAVLSRVKRPARYVGGEVGQVMKDPSSVECRFCLVFPDLYEIGLSNYGLQILYYLLNERTDTFCESAYAVAFSFRRMRSTPATMFPHWSEPPICTLQPYSL